MLLIISKEAWTDVYELIISLDGRYNRFIRWFARWFYYLYEEKILYIYIYIYRYRYVTENIYIFMSIWKNVSHNQQQPILFCFHFSLSFDKYKTTMFFFKYYIILQVHKFALKVCNAYLWVGGRSLSINRWSVVDVLIGSNEMKKGKMWFCFFIEKKTN